MSQKEIKRLECLEKLASQQLSQIEAARLLDITTRHIRRLQRAHEKEGAKSLISKRRGKPSNNKLHTSIKEEALTLIREKYADFGPTLAHEKLVELHGFKLSLESLRKMMIDARIWKGKRRKVMTVHQMRSRRACLGELIQIDGSPHAWFEDRGPKCCLLVFVDDATGKIMMLHFEKEESAQGYFDATYKYIIRHGIPIAFYSDRHGIFRVNIKDAKSGTGETQYSRALRELDVTLINANSPQAKGRVENKNGTLQDRLVKELRLQNISDMKSANAFLPDFIKDYNRRFAKLPASPSNLHRKRQLPTKELRDILSYQHERTITKNLEVHYQNKIYQIQSKSPGYTMRRAKIIIHDDHGNIALIYKGNSLAYKVFESHKKETPIASAKQLDSIIEKAKHTRTKSSYKPSKDHPWRNYPDKHSPQPSGSV